MKKKKIALLFGGTSNEREISIKTGKQIQGALNKDKWIVTTYDLKTDMKKFLNDAMNKKFDLVFPALHGAYGEDGRLQGMLDMLNIPYVFSDCLSSALAMNKYKTKLVVKEKKIPVPKDIVLNKGEEINISKIVKELKLPVVIKPMEAGSSVGISIAKTRKDLEKGIKDAFKYGDEILLEQFIKGRELTVTVIGTENPEAFPVMEIIANKGAFYDYKSKYTKGGSDHICPADIPKSVGIAAMEYSIEAHKAIGCKDLTRSDFMMDKNNKLYFIEINTIPGMTALSLSPQAAEAVGIEFTDFLDILIEQNFS